MKLNSNITISDAQSTLKMTSDILDETGPRLTGSKSCKLAGKLLQTYLKKFCTKTASELFYCNRDAFLYHIRYFSISYIIAFIFLCIGGPWIYAAAFITTFGCIFILFEFVFYFEFIDPLFNKTEANNIYGILEPKKKVNQQIIISGHYDSPYVFGFLNKNQKFYKIKIALNNIFYFSITLLSLSYSYLQFFSNSNIKLDFIVILILGIGIYFLSQYFFFINWEVSPGAGDNLVSSCMIIKLSEIFSKNKSKLQNTRLIFLCPDAEESGLRGAKDYVKRHFKELQSIPTYNINMDSIYRLEDLRFLESERNGTIPLNMNLINQFKKIAKSLGYNIKSMGMPFGGGSTDAAEFAKSGVSTLSIIGLDTTFKSGDVPYHTSYDTVEKIEPEAVLACLQITERFILKIDQSIT